MSNGEENNAALAPPMTDLDALLAMMAPLVATPESNANNPLLGYGDPYMTPARVDPADLALLQGAVPPPIQQRDEVRFSDVQQILTGLDDEDKDALAVEMYAAGVVSDIDDLFNENFERDEIVFNSAVEDTINLAARGAELGFETTFLKVLMGAGSSDRRSVEMALAKAKAEAAEAKKKGGRVIQWASPKVIVKSLREESEDELGRKASKREKQNFVKRIHNMQAKGLSVNLAAEAEAAAREAAPVEAGAMDYTKATNRVMQVISSKLGRA